MELFIHKAHGFEFQWSGGAYIDIYVIGESTPFDVYNVWDYEKDAPSIERTTQALAEFVDNEIRESGLPELPN